jgi:hypothetical protein
MIILKSVWVLVEMGSMYLNVLGVLKCLLQHWHEVLIVCLLCLLDSTWVMHSTKIQKLQKNCDISF